MNGKPKQAQTGVNRRGEPELTLVKRGEDSNPRLVALVRLLARQAARNFYKQQMKDRDARPLPIRAGRSLFRDQEDIAGVFERMAYADVKIVTLS